MGLIFVGDIICIADGSLRKVLSFGLSDFYLSEEKSYIGLLDRAEFLINSDPNVPFCETQTASIDLKPGFNLVSFGNISTEEDLTAYDILSDIGGPEVIRSIQRFNPATGVFETSAYDETGQITGIDFNILSGEGYIIYMKQEVVDFIY